MPGQLALVVDDDLACDFKLLIETHPALMSGSDVAKVPGQIHPSKRWHSKAVR